MPQIPRGLIWDQTHASSMRCPRLTACTIVHLAALTAPEEEISDVCHVVGRSSVGIIPLTDITPARRTEMSLTAQLSSMSSARYQTQNAVLFINTATDNDNAQYAPRDLWRPVPSVKTIWRTLRCVRKVEQMKIVCSKMNCTRCRPGCAMAQEKSCPAQAVVRSHTMLWEICGEQSGSETGFYPSTLSGIPLMLSSLIVHRGYIVLAVVGVVT
jgi:hypothetical protein